MRIALVRYHDIKNVNTRLPESLNKRQGILPPLGISYIGASLEKEGHEVRIIDAQALGLTRENLYYELKSFKPSLVGVTTMTPNLHGALEACQVAKSAGTKVVLGGPHTELFPTECLSFDFIDYVILGEGELAMVQLAEALEEGLSLDTIEGLCYRGIKEAILINKVAIIKDVNSLPWPARHLLPMDKYSSIIGLHPTTTMITSRGCPFRCSFCYKQEIDKKIRFREATDVVDEMEMLVKNYKIKEIMFYDDVFTLKKEHVYGICEEILKRGLHVKWEAPTRADCVTADMLDLMAKSGCLRVRFGIESGDRDILKLMGKQSNIEIAIKAVEAAKRAGLQTFAYFIVGYLHESQAQFNKTIELAKKLPLDSVMFTAATPLPGTLLHKQAIEAGLIEPNYWSDFSLGKVNSRINYLVPDAPLRVRKAYQAFYFRPKFILSKILQIDSIYTLKKYWDALIGLLNFRMS